MLKQIFFFLVLQQILSFNSVTSQENLIRIDNPENKTLIQINTGEKGYLQHNKKTLLVFYALPNGNSIEWTMGKKLQPGDDWHFDIQHIAAQSRFIREAMPDQNIIVIYLYNHLKSWPAWKRQRTDAPLEIKRIVDSITQIFTSYQPKIMLNSHSGGGSFIFGYLDAVKQIPKNIHRISFIDSNYGYEDSLHGQKLIQWLASSQAHYLNILAYNDSIVIFNGKPLVSPTGGTWFRSKMMKNKLSESFPLTMSRDTSFIYYRSILNKIDIRLKINENGIIYHTEQVVRNGFIHSILSGTSYQKKAKYVYWGPRAYDGYILP